MDWLDVEMQDTEEQSPSQQQTSGLEFKTFHTLMSAADASPPLSLESTNQPPHSYSVIFDNLDFYMPTHHQSMDRSNKSIHWTHLMAVEDRVPTHHLSNEKPQQSTTAYPILKSLLDPDSQLTMQQEFIVLGARILTQHLDAFKPLRNVVIHHIPHEYSENMSKASTHVSAVIYKMQLVLPFSVNVYRHKPVLL